MTGRRAAARAARAALRGEGPPVDLVGRAEPPAPAPPAAPAPEAAAPAPAPPAPLPPPLRLLWPISCDGAVLVVRRGHECPEVRRVSVWRWIACSDAWWGRQRRVSAGERPVPSPQAEDEIAALLAENAQLRKIVLPQEALRKELLAARRDREALAAVLEKLRRDLSRREPAPEGRSP